MRLNGAQTGSDRRGWADPRRRLLACLSFLLGLWMAPVFAGDRALVDIIGYSEDGRFFAFEEFGIQDGSGFAYSNIFMIDLEEDAWVVGTPIRVQAESENASLADIRSQAQAKAHPDLVALKIVVPAQMLAAIGDGVPNTDAQTLEFGIPAYGVGAVGERYRLELSSFFTPAASPCEEWFGVQPLGYALSLKQGTQSSTIHRDTSLPRSRGCPFTYRLYAVFLPFEAGDISDAVALISVFPGGFEGPDRRFLAVPLASHAP